METAIKFSGYIGAVLIGFGVIGSFVVNDFTGQPLLVAHIVLGVLCLVAWGVTSGLEGLNKASSSLYGRTARFGANAALYTAVVMGIIVVVNVLVSMNDTRWDVTEAGVYSLSEKSIKLIKDLKGSLRLVAVNAPQVQDKRQSEELLDLYEYHNKVKVKAEFVDPQTRPLEIKKLGFKPGELLHLEYSENGKSSVSKLNKIDEQSITNAIIKLTRGAMKKIYYVQGHGEPRISEAAQGGMKDFADALTNEHLILEGLTLTQKGSVPSDAAAVIVANPKVAMQQMEKDALVQYGNGGGRLVLLADPENRDVRDVAEIAEKFGITVGNDIVIDQQLKLFAGPQLAVEFHAQQFGAHPITSRLAGSEAPIFSFASSVVAGKGDAKSTYVELIQSGAASWAEKNLSLIFDNPEPAAAKDQDDVSGPVSIAVALERKLDAAKSVASDEEAFDKQSRIVVFGDGTWLLNGYFQAIGNHDLALNVVNWVAGEEGGVAIGPKSMRPSMMPINQQNYNLILACSFLGPELILLIGLFVWWNRRHLAA